MENKILNEEADRLMECVEPRTALVLNEARNQYNNNRHNPDKLRNFLEELFTAWVEAINNRGLKK